MKLSFTGCSVPWMMKTSRPRTFSWTRTKTFPSLKILVSDWATSIPSLEQMAWASPRLARPAKIFSSPNGSVGLVGGIAAKSMTD